MAKIELTFITEERESVFQEINALNLDYEYSPWSNNCIIVEGSKYDMESFGYYLDEQEIMWSKK